MSQVKWTEQKVDELIDMARAGEPWEAITVHFYPGKSRSVRAAARIFDKRATADDRAARQQALADRNFNHPPIYRNRGCGGGSTERPEPALRREMRSPWAGMGSCFA